MKAKRKKILFLTYFALKLGDQHTIVEAFTSCNKCPGNKITDFGKDYTTEEACMAKCNESTPNTN